MKLEKRVERKNDGGERIFSATNPKVKHLVKLRLSGDYRKEHQSVLIIGEILIQELLSVVKPKSLLSSKATSVKDCLRTTPEILKKITGLKDFEGMIGEFPAPSPSSLTGKKWILLIDRITDPGNLGTLLRACLALGWEGVFFLPECVDPFNEKSLRASKGALFHLPFMFGTWEDVIKLKESEQLSLLIADTQGTNAASLSTKGAILALSHEAQGPSRQALQFGQPITIPLAENVESLNVAVAGGILLYLLKNGNSP